MFSRQRLRDALNNGKVVRLLPDCYVAARYAESFHARCAAALHWAGPGSAIGGPAALYLWQLLDTEPDHVHVVVSTSLRRSTPPWLAMYRTESRWTPVTLNTWKVVPVAIAIAQGYGKLDARKRSDVLFGAFSRGLVSVEAMLQALESLPRIPRRRELRQRLMRIARGAHSFLEEQTIRRVFNTVEFQHLIPQFTVRLHGRTYRFDLYDSETKTAIELDGARYHSDVESRRRDIRRDVDVASAGILTVRFSYQDLMNRPEWCRDRLRAVLNQRRTS